MIKHGEQVSVTIMGTIWAVIDSAFFAAALGRLYWHCRLVVKGERKLFGPEAVLEPFCVLLGYIAGTAIAAYLGLDGRAAQGLVLVVSYLGPDGFQAIMNKYLSGTAK